MSYLLRSGISPAWNVQYIGSLVPSLQTFTELTEKAVIWYTKRALGAFTFLSFLSQIAVTGDRLTKRLSDQRRLCRKEKGKKRRWRSYSTAGRSGWQKETEGDGLTAVWNLTSVQGESI